MAIIRIPRASVPAGGADDLTTALRGLAPAGALAKTAGSLSGNADLGAIGSGLSGLVGLTRGIAGGDPGQSIGGAANLGSGLASLAGYPGVSAGLGAVGGPLTLATGLASGDPVSSVLGGAQTASLASGYLGGPTLGSLTSAGLEGLYSILPGATAAGAEALGLGGGALAAGSASELGLGAAAAAGGGLGASLAGGLALGPFALLIAGGLHAAMTGGGDMFDSIFGTDHTQPWSQQNEYKQYGGEFPGLAQRRVAGAGLYDSLGEERDPADLDSALRTAASGMHANTEPAAWNLSHRPTALPGLKPMDLSGWDAASPELGGHNAASFLGLMDQGQAAGLDAGGMTGDWNLDPQHANTTGDEYRTRVGSYGTENQLHGPIEQTQEAQDLGNAVAGLGKHLGIDWAAKDPTGGYENFDADQLKGYGFTPGNYGAASLNYLKTFDPSVTDSPEWEGYTKALDPGNTLAGLDPLTLTPRKLPGRVDGYTPELNLGGM